MTNGGGQHGSKARKRTTGKKPNGEKAKVSAKRKNWVPDGLVKEAARKGPGGN